MSSAGAVQPRSCSDDRVRGHARPPRPGLPALRLFQPRPPASAPRTRRSAGKMESKARGAPAPRSPLCPSRRGTRGPETRPVRPRRPGEAAGQRGRTARAAAAEPRPPRPRSYLPRLKRFGRPDPACGENKPTRQPLRWGPRCRPRRSRPCPLRQGRDRAPTTPFGPSPPPCGGGLWGGATNPSPKSGGSTNIRPIPPKEPTPRAVLTYGRPGLLRPSLPRLPRSRLTLVCFGRTGSGEGVLYGTGAVLKGALS